MHVEQHDLRLGRRDEVDGFVDGRRFAEDTDAVGQVGAQAGAEDGVVVDDHHGEVGWRRSGVDMVCSVGQGEEEADFGAGAARARAEFGGAADASHPPEDRLAHTHPVGRGCRRG